MKTNEEIQSELAKVIASDERLVNKLFAVWTALEVKDKECARRVMDERKKLLKLLPRKVIHRFSGLAPYLANRPIKEEMDQSWMNGFNYAVKIIRATLTKTDNQKDV